MVLAFFAGMVTAFYLVVAAGVWLEETELAGRSNWEALRVALQWPWFALRGAIRPWLGKD